MEDGPHKTNEKLVAELKSPRQRLDNLNQMVEGREDAVDPSEQLGDLSRIYKEAPIGLCYLDTDLRFLQINDWLAAVNGLSIEDHLGRTIGEVLPDVAKGVEAQFRHVIETGEPIVLGTVEAETAAQPGVTRTFEHTYNPIRSDDGTVAGISCVVQDVTERKQMERSLEEAFDDLKMQADGRTEQLHEAHHRLMREIAERVRLAARFEALLNAAPDATISVDWKGKIVEANEQVERSFGYNRHELIGQDLEILIPDHLRDRHIQHRRAYSRNPKFRNMGSGLELLILCKDGRMKPVEVSLSPAEVAGDDVVIASIRDVTQRKEAENLLQKSNEALQNLSARLIHAQEEEGRRIARELHDDLGQNLAVLTIDLELFRNQLSDPEKSISTFLESQLRQAKDLSSKLQSLSRHLHPSIIEHVGLNSAVSSFCGELSERHDIEIEFKHNDVSPALSNDVSLCLYRIVQEALRNVIRHSGARTALIEINQTGKAVALRISDTGKGFDPTSDKSSRGLGLLSMRERLRIFDGEFTVTQIEPNGTQIDAWVPLQDSDPALHVRGKSTTSERRES